MIIEFKYKDNVGKQQTVVKNLDPACIQVERVYIGHTQYWIDRRELHLKEPKIIIWLKR